MVHKDRRLLAAAHLPKRGWNFAAKLNNQIVRLANRRRGLKFALDIQINGV
jgi:hypothetical protein